MDRCIKSVTIGDAEYNEFDYCMVTFVMEMRALSQILNHLEEQAHEADGALTRFEVDGLMVEPVGDFPAYDIDGGVWFVNDYGQLAVTYPKDPVEPEDGSLDFAYEIPADIWLRPVRAMKALLTLVKEK